jgi:hypothetical protein
MLQVRAVREAKIDALFLKLLTALCAQGRALSPNPSPAYAPRVFETHADAGGTKAKAFANYRLLAADMIHVAESDPPSKRRSQLAPGPKPNRTTNEPHREDAQIEAAFEVEGAGGARGEANQPIEQASGN